MRDSASWKSENHNGFVTLQVFPSSRLEVFANTSFNSGRGAIEGLMFDPTILPAQPTGLDFIMQSNTMSGFSALEARHVVQTVGLNYRLTDNLVLNSAFLYNDLGDSLPYLFDATGRHVSFMAGVNWVF